MPAPLPSAQDLGTRTPEPRTNVASIRNPGAVGNAMQQAGSDLARTGATIQEKQDKVELARAKSYWLNEQIKANSDFENDQDYATMQERYSKRMLDAKASALGMISDKGNQEIFNTELAPDYQRGVSSVKSLVYKRTVDTGRSNFRQATDDNQQAMLQAADEASRASIIKAQQELINANHARGFLTAEEKQKEATDFVQNYAVQRAQTEMQADPKGMLKLLKPTAASRKVSELSQTTANKYKGVSPTYLTTVAAIETGGSFDAGSHNQGSGARGMFQITPTTAKELGVRDPHDPEQSADGTARLALKNTPILAKALGRQPTDGELYLAHQQGGAGAAALLKNPSENVVDALAKAYDGNRGKARAAVIQNGGSTTSSAKEFSGQWTDKYADFEGKYAGPNVQVASLDTKGVIGNIDLSNRPRVKNADGSISTVRSMSFSEGGKEILVPTVSDDGKILSEKEAIAQYHETGKFLGKFDSVQDADAYAEKLHQDQAAQYVPEATTTTPGTLPHFEKTGTWVDYLPYDKRVTLINNAETQLRQDRTVNKQLLDAKVKDANSMALQGFEDPKPPSLTEFEDAYEGPEAELRYREYRQTQKVAGTIHQSATMTPGEQATTLITLKPKPGPGFAEEQKNYEALQTGITEANSQRKADPIAFAQKYNMDPSAQPLDLKDPESLVPQLAQRGHLGVAMNRDYGVPLRVFTEPEAQTLATRMNGMTATQRLGTLTTINAGLQDNPTAYTAAMGQLRPASPVTAYAGTYLGLKGSISDAKDLPVTPQSVASGILQGEDLINPPKDSEGKETKPAIKMPSPEGSTFLGGMRSDFNDTWGTALQGQPQAANDAFEAARAYYAYLSAQSGDYDGKYDADRFESAMTAVMGNAAPVEIGDSAVLAPWGMAEDQFKDGAKVAFTRTAAEQGLKNWDFNDVSFLGTGRPGEYTIQNGTMNMVDKKGFPVVVKVTAGDVEMDPNLGVPRSILDDNRRRYGSQPYPGTKE